MRTLLLTLALSLATVPCWSETPTKTVELFDGKTLTGWSLLTNPASDIAAICHVTSVGTLAVLGKPVGYLLATGTYENYRLHVEWRWPADAKKNSNSGVLLNIASGPIDRNTWPICLQVQMKLNHAGDFLPMAGFTFKEPLSTAAGAATPQLNGLKLPAEKPLGEWNECDIICRGDTIECSVNGVQENKITGCKPAVGQIGFQLEGTPYELRHVTLSPLE